MSGNGLRRDAVSCACFLSIFQATKNIHCTLSNWSLIISDQLDQDILILLWRVDDQIPWSKVLWIERSEKLVCPSRLVSQPSSHPLQHVWKLETRREVSDVGNCLQGSIVISSITGGQPRESFCGLSAENFFMMMPFLLSICRSPERG